MVTVTLTVEQAELVAKQLAGILEMHNTEHFLGFHKPQDCYKCNLLSEVHDNIVYNLPPLEETE